MTISPDQDPGKVHMPSSTSTLMSVFHCKGGISGEIYSFAESGACGEKFCWIKSPMQPTIDLSYSLRLTQMTYNEGRSRTRSFQGGMAQSKRHAHKILQFENWNLIENNGTRNTSTFLEFLHFSVIIFTICFTFLASPKGGGQPPNPPRQWGWCN